VTDEEGHSGDELVSVNMGEVEDVEEGAEGDEEGYSGDELMRHSGDEEHSEEEYNEESTEEESTEEEEEEEEDYPLRCNGPHHTTEVPRHTTPRRSTPPGHNALGQNPNSKTSNPISAYLSAARGRAHLRTRRANRRRALNCRLRELNGCGIHAPHAALPDPTSLFETTLPTLTIYTP